MLSEFRLSAFRALDGNLNVGGQQVQVDQFLVDDLPGLPYVAVGRPGLQPSGQLPGAWDLTLTVYVIGNRISTQEQQKDLDDLAWMVTELLDKYQYPAPIAGVAVVSVTPVLTAVAAQEYPAYQVALAGTSNVCR